MYCIIYIINTQLYPVYVITDCGLCNFAHITHWSHSCFHQKPDYCVFSKQSWEVKREDSEQMFNVLPVHLILQWKNIRIGQLLYKIMILWWLWADHKAGLKLSRHLGLFLLEWQKNRFQYAMWVIIE